jgi:fatty acid desaturase
MRSLHPRLPDLGLHLARLGAAIVAVALADRASSRVGMAAAGALVFLEAFALMHDLAHGALRLPRAVNEVALAAAGTLLLMSGHALRQTHLAHHAHPLGDADVEGRPARGSFGHALATGPAATLELRVHAYRKAGARGRAWQAAETLVDVALASMLLASGHAPLVIYVVVALAAQATMSVWAAHVPHNAPAWLTTLAARLGWTGSPTVLALAYHELHHARPSVPCQRLAATARPAFAHAAATALR